jgi:HSP20 family molecular chaperone IbpA
MAVELRRRPRGWPSLSDWFDDPPMAPCTEIEAQKMRVEECEKDGCYLVRAELPGIDRDDIEVRVDEGVLTVTAERREKERDKTYSEFRYGSFLRSVQLPLGADEDHIEASYDKGVLTVTAPLRGPGRTGRSIEITHR